MTITRRRGGSGTGTDGASAYDLWLDQGNTGTVDDFLASLQGPQGEQGPPGAPGDGSGSGVAQARFMGTWQPLTAYLRGDIVQHPSLATDLRQASQNHTSGLTFATGNEFTQSNQWASVALPGFRGNWQASANYTANEHVKSPETGQIVQALYTHTSGVFSAARFRTSVLPTFPADARPETVMPVPGIVDLDGNVTHGFFPVRSRLRYPQPTTRKILTSAALTSVSGAGAISNDPDPPSPTGAALITFPKVASWTFSSPVDITTSIVRLLMKLTGATGGSSSTPRLFAGISGGIFLELSSSSSFTNCVQVDLVHHNESNGFHPDGEWFYGGCGPESWVDVGSGATRTAITHGRINCAGSATTISLAWLDLIANGLADKGKIVLWGDDDYDAGWDIIALKAFPKGWPVTFAATIGNVAPSQNNAMISERHMRNLAMLESQTASHAFTTPEHNTPTEPGGTLIGGAAFREQVMKMRHLQNALGGRGGDDFACPGNNFMLTRDTMDALRTYYRSVRGFLTQPRVVECLPPVEPHRMWAWGVSTADITDAGAAMIAYAQKAADQKGLAQFVWHDAPNVELDNLLAWADAHRSVIDVVTIAEALEPWTVAA